VGRVDTVFKVGDRVLLRTKDLRLLDAADIGTLRPRWDGPLHRDRLPEPQRLHPRAAAEDALQPDGQRRPAQAHPSAPGQVSNVGQEGERHAVELLLNRREVRGVTRYLVRWRGHTSADDEWLRREELAHCQEKVAEYDAATPRRSAARRADPAAVPAAGHPAAPALAPAAATLVPPAWFRLAATSEVLSVTALVGQTVLYRWPEDGWVRGTVVGRSRTAGLSHVVRYGRASALGSAVVPSLLDAASHGPAGQWVLLRRMTRQSGSL
jgi:hypothetical protein